MGSKSSWTGTANFLREARECARQMKHDYDGARQGRARCLDLENGSLGSRPSVSLGSEGYTHSSVIVKEVRGTGDSN
jgi:hypothetical protein